MNRTQKSLLCLHADITAYAAAKVRKYGLPRCDLGDIVSEAYLKAQAKMPRHTPRTNRKTLFKTIAWCEVMRELDKRNRVVALHEKLDLRLDADKQSEDETEGDEELENDGFAISDNGEGAARIRLFDEPDEPEIPEWVFAVRVQYERERRMPRKVLDRLKYVWDYEKVRLSFKLEKEEFYTILKKLQHRFDQCFRAYHEWKLEKSLKLK